MNAYEGIVEVQGLPPSRVNRWLEGGYKLLSIEIVTVSGRHPVDSPGANAGAYFVRRAIRYVVGRTADVTVIPWDLVEETPAS